MGIILEAGFGCARVSYMTHIYRQHSKIGVIYEVGKCFYIQKYIEHGHLVESVESKLDLCNPRVVEELEEFLSNAISY